MAPKWNVKVQFVEQLCKEYAVLMAPKWNVKDNASEFAKRMTEY